MPSNEASDDVAREKNQLRAATEVMTKVADRNAQVIDVLRDWRDSHAQLGGALRELVELLEPLSASSSTECSNLDSVRKAWKDHILRRGRSRLRRLFDGSSDSGSDSGSESDSCDSPKLPRSCRPPPQTVVEDGRLVLGPRADSSTGGSGTCHSLGDNALLSPRAGFKGTPNWGNQELRKVLNVSSEHYDEEDDGESSSSSFDLEVDEDQARKLRDFEDDPLVGLPWLNRLPRSLRRISESNEATDDYDDMSGDDSSLSSTDSGNHIVSKLGKLNSMCKASKWRVDANHSDF